MLGWANKGRSDTGEPCPSSPCSVPPQREVPEEMRKHSCRHMIRPRHSLLMFLDLAEATCTGGDDCTTLLRTDQSSESPTGLEPHGLCPCVVSTPWKLVCSIWKGRLPVCCASPVCVVGRKRCSPDGRTAEVPMSLCKETKRKDSPKGADLSAPVSWGRWIEDLVPAITNRPRRTLSRNWINSFLNFDRFLLGVLEKERFP
jgi:hypothetical protein